MIASIQIDWGSEMGNQFLCESTTILFRWNLILSQKSINLLYKNWGALIQLKGWLKAISSFFISVPSRMGFSSMPYCFSITTP